MSNQGKVSVSILKGAKIAEGANITIGPTTVAHTVISYSSEKPKSKSPKKDTVELPAVESSEKDEVKEEKTKAAQTVSDNPPRQVINIGPKTTIGSEFLQVGNDWFMLTDIVCDRVTTGQDASGRTGRTFLWDGHRVDTHSGQFVYDQKPIDMTETFGNERAMSWKVFTDKLANAVQTK